MNHTARDMLKEEMDKLSRWQISLVDKNGAVQKKAQAMFKDQAKFQEVVKTLFTGAETLFASWEVLNEGLAEGKEIQEHQVKYIRDVNLEMGGSATESGGADGRGVNGFYAKSSSGQLLVKELQDWVEFKNLINDDSHNAAFIKQLDLHHLPNWLDHLYELVMNAGLADTINVMKTGLAEFEELANDFQQKAEKFFKDVPEGVEKFYDPKDEQSKIRLTRTLLGVGGGPKADGKELTLSNMKNDSRKSIQNVMTFNQTFLSANRALLSMVNDVSSLGEHFGVVLHKVAVAAAKDFKDDGQEVPADLQEAIDALSPKALKG